MQNLHDDLRRADRKLLIVTVAIVIIAGMTGYLLGTLNCISH